MHEGHRIPEHPPSVPDRHVVALAAAAPDGELVTLYLRERESWGLVSRVAEGFDLARRTFREYLMEMTAAWMRRLTEACARSIVVHEPGETGTVMLESHALDAEPYLRGPAVMAEDSGPPAQTGRARASWGISVGRAASDAALDACVVDTRGIEREGITAALADEILAVAADPDTWIVNPDARLGAVETPAGEVPFSVGDMQAASEFIQSRSFSGQLFNGGALHRLQVRLEEVVEAVHDSVLSPADARGLLSTAGNSLDENAYVSLTQAESYFAKCHRADARAEALLTRLLSDEQLETWASGRYFDVTGGMTGHRYRLSYLSSYNIRNLTRNLSMCVVLNGVPLCDQLVAQKLMLESDEQELLRVANFHRDFNFSYFGHRDLFLRNMPQLLFRPSEGYVRQAIDQVARSLEGLTEATREAAAAAEALNQAREGGVNGPIGTSESIEIEDGTLNGERS